MNEPKKVDKAISQVVAWFLVPALFGIVLNGIGIAAQDHAARFVGSTLAFTGMGGTLAAALIGAKLKK